MNITASIQARMSSERLPGKVLEIVEGKPLLLWQIERIKKSCLLDHVIVATTTNPKDDAIVEMCKQHNVAWYRGSENDVLDRISGLIEEHEVDVHVEFCGDSPLPDWHIIDSVIEYYLKNRDRYDFVSNSQRVTYPPGMEVVVYDGRTLLDLNRTLEPTHPMREHVSAQIPNSKDLYRCFNLEAPPEYHFPEIYLEVDEPPDLEFIRTILQHFRMKGNLDFTLGQVLEFLQENDELSHLNVDIHRRWKENKDD